MMESHLIFDALDNLKGYNIRASVVSMWYDSNPYKKPLIFKFRFENVNHDNIIYSKLAKCINEFNGNLKWSLIDSNNKYILVPNELYDLQKFDGRYSRDYLIEKIGDKKYKEIIDLGIQDVKPLSMKIRRVV